MCVVCQGCLRVFFFFKQKTAYEMRISDWSSDVCSSDLAAVEPASGRAGMIGDVAAVVAEALGVLRDFDDRVRRQELVRLFGLIERQRDVDFHAGLGSVECGALTTECHLSAYICRRC